MVRVVEIIRKPNKVKRIDYRGCRILELLVGTMSTIFNLSSNIHLLMLCVEHPVIVVSCVVNVILIMQTPMTDECDQR